MLLGNSEPWPQHVDNHVIYSFDVTKCMFSSGNITEKLRVARFKCADEVVVDMYAGIGYFTLPYLVHARAKYMHACDWNPDAVEALKRNLVLNGVQDRCTVYFGDNAVVCPQNVADRVNLGLIPTSKAGWPVVRLHRKHGVPQILMVRISGHSRTQPRPRRLVSCTREHYNQSCRLARAAHSLGASREANCKRV